MFIKPILPLSNPKYTPYIYSTKASIAIVGKHFIPEKEFNTTLIKVDDAYKSFALLLEYYNQAKSQKEGIEKPSYISENSAIGEAVYIGAFAYIGGETLIGNNVKIYPNVYVGDNVKIGDNTVIFSGAKIYSETEIGKNCVINSGAIIGADGFGFAPSPSLITLYCKPLGVVITPFFSLLSAKYRSFTPTRRLSLISK